MVGQGKNLKDTTCDLLNEEGVNLSLLASTLGIDYDWLNKMRRRAIKDPSVNRVQMVYEALTKTPLIKESSNEL
jgi:hypothetical protein